MTIKAIGRLLGREWVRVEYVPDRLKINGVRLGSGTWYPPEQVEKIKEHILSIPDPFHDPIKEKRDKLIEEGYRTVGEIAAEINKKWIRSSNIPDSLKENETVIAGDVLYPPEQVAKIKDYFLGKTKEEKYKFVCKERFGVDNPSKSEEVQKKKEETMMKHWGTTKSFELQQTKDTIKERYGVDNISQAKEIKEKKARNRTTNFFHDGIYFDSSWEVAYYIYLKENDIPFEYHPAPISYLCEGKEQDYFPDFKVGDELVEIKGNQFFNKDGEFVSGFEQEQTEEDKAKWQCMMDNHVRLIRKDDIMKHIKFAEKILGENIYDYLRRTLDGVRGTEKSGSEKD